MLRRVEWHKQPKMTIQLLSIACLFIVINMPPIFIQITIMTGVENNLVEFYEAKSFFGYSTYYQSILLPFVCLFPLLSNVRTTLKKIVRPGAYPTLRLKVKIAPITN